MQIRPIGFVHNATEEKTDWEELVSEIEILPEFEEGLHRIEEIPEIYVIFYFDRADSIRMRVHPKNDPNIPERGVFSTRSPTRPNFLGLTRVTLLGRRGNLLSVKGLDAYDGTPVIDIKPAVRLDCLDKNEK